MGVKTYLSQQIKLLSISSFDLFTDEEMKIYNEIVSLKNEIDKLEDLKTNPLGQIALDKKRELVSKLQEEVAKQDSTPREINLNSILSSDAERKDGICWWNVKLSRRIAEFCSEQSRQMGLKQDDITFDKIIVKWKSLDILKQIIKNGFYANIINEEGVVEKKFYRLFTSSAGQLRRDKVQFMEVSMIDKIHDSIWCGLDWETLNKAGGINISKILAYTALTGGATEVWDMDIDRCIVIDEFESNVTGRMTLINKDYTSKNDVFTMTLDQTDGIGMMLDNTPPFMCRGPWLKGLMVHFDYLKFCKKNNCPPLIKDVWGDYHRLDTEDIRVIFTSSQLKLYKYYKDWNDYKEKFKQCKCNLCKTNWEDEYDEEDPRKLEGLSDIKNTEINYQMLQTLVDFKDEDIKSFIKNHKDKIINISKNKHTMLKALNADKNSIRAYEKALWYYPALLRDGYSRETLKAIKKKWILNGKSGYIVCENKRLFCSPDLYAACEYWFLHKPNPEGLIPNGYVAAKRYKNVGEIDCLRSPHLYMEHAVRNVIKDKNVYDWLDQDIIYTSCQDLISRILQCDFDGDHINCVTNKIIINTAKENIKNHNIVPLFYDAAKTPKELITWDNMYEGIKRAHENSSIGEVSNALTKLWNKPNPDYESAQFITAFNNWVIDAAKTGDNNSWERYPHVKKQISKAIGGKTGKMPMFFKFSRNGRRLRNKKYNQFSGSTMDKIAKEFDDIPTMNFNYAGVETFNYKMLLEEEYDFDINEEAVNLFCDIDNKTIPIKIALNVNNDGSSDRPDMEDISESYELMKEEIIHELEKKYTLKEVYPSIVKHLFTGDNFNKQTHKQMFWRVFGDIAVENIINNINKSSVCSNCMKRVPDWEDHECSKLAPTGFFFCEMCGKLTEKNVGGRSHNKKYCDDCSEIAKTRKAMERMRKMRAKKNNKKG